MYSLHSNQYCCLYVYIYMHYIKSVRSLHNFDIGLRTLCSTQVETAYARETKTLTLTQLTLTRKPS